MMTLDELTERLDDFADKSISMADHMVRGRPYRHMLLPWSFASSMMLIVVAVDVVSQAARCIITIAYSLMMIALCYIAAGAAWAIAYPFIMLGGMCGWRKKHGRVDSP